MKDAADLVDIFFISLWLLQLITCFLLIFLLLSRFHAFSVLLTVFLQEKQQTLKSLPVLMNLHPHAVLSCVLWKWYQSPFGL